ncbi:zinc finger CCCH domain-containing protein 44-like [Juglans regia]|uniref:Zinc finger CCCH domain-containing protein 44-like n=2 Tax=Juglans regia TaxID=51240 RepID=A0A2I4H7H1_JUGRE|nr:zinc finger CCCH domain-containing protein 44-like [Juglans regia]
MATSLGLGLFSTSLSSKTASLTVKPSWSSSSPILHPHQVPANLRTVRTVTYATVSNEAPGKRAPRGIMKPRRVSPEMQDLVGVPEISRTQALKQIWAHIKEHNLQDPENKRIIICDEKLKKIFGGKERIGFLEIAGLISPHFLK